MIDASMIPDEALDAGLLTLVRKHATTADAFRAALAAALNAWETPMHKAIVGKALDEVGTMYPALILPLKKEGE